ncbi:hypothetical protein MKZ12_07985 [Paenibacillus sp. FSL R5-0713]|uniref:hypothetical protein n=1 Tax=Paenibacillus sp. FSL R5-0713 TaxID=2921655 RepID=UPI0030DA1EE1
MSSSFINERSAEYILVPKFVEHLTQISTKITPIFFWATREGATHSKSSFKDKKLLIAAMYARRPKVYNLLDIELKFNEELFSRAEYLNKNGISVFAGAPLVSRFEELNFDASCIWFNLKPNEKNKDIVLRVNSVDGSIYNSKSYNSLTGVSSSEIVDIIKGISKEFTWSEAIEIIKNNKYYNIHSRWFLTGGYKPVYFIIDVSEKCGQNVQAFSPLPRSSRGILDK